MGRHPGHPGGHTASTRKPITVWNITRTCNLRCVHCYSDSNALNYPGELTWPEMENVIDDLSAYQVPSLLLSGGEACVGIEEHNAFWLFDRTSLFTRHAQEVFLRLFWRIVEP